MISHGAKERLNMEYSPCLQKHILCKKSSIRKKNHSKFKIEILIPKHPRSRQSEGPDEIQNTAILH